MPQKGGKQTSELSLAFVVTTISLILILGFVLILGQVLQTQDFLYEQFQKSHDRIDALRIQIEDLKR